MAPKKNKNKTLIKAKRVLVLNGKKNSKGKQALRTTGKALKSAARGVLAAGSQILGAGAKALNPGKKKSTKTRRPARKGKRNPNYTVEAIPKYKDTVKETVNAITRGSAVRKVKKQVPGPKNVYRYRVEKNPKRNKKSAAAKQRRRNKAPHISESDIAKLSPKAQEQLRAQLRQVEAKESRATTPAQKKAAAKSRRSFLSRLGTRLRVIGQTKKVKVSARDLGRCKRKVVKVRSRHETDALAKAQSKLGRGYDDFKVQNPKTRKKAAKKRNCSSRSGRPRKGNPTPEEIRKSFAGSVAGHRDLYFPVGTPNGLAKLGKLVSITTEEGTIKPVHGTAWLCADMAGKLHLGSVSASPLFDGPKRSFGKVSKIEYETAKPHLGYKNPVIWFHHMGEENGVQPTLRADGRGGLVFRGGAYRVTSRGVEN